MEEGARDVQVLRRAVRPRAGRPGVWRVDAVAPLVTTHAKVHHHVRGPDSEVWVGLSALVLIALVVVGGVRVSPVVFALPLVGVLLALGVMRQRRFQRSRAEAKKGEAAAGLPSRYRWIPVAWVLLAFVNVQKFTPAALRGESVTRSGGLKLENVVELSLYAAVAALVFAQWVPAAGQSVTARRILLLAWPCWAFTTALWSLIPAYTLVRGVELFVPLALALFSARVLDRNNADALALAQPFLRIFLNLCTALAVLAFAFPYDSGAQARAAAGITAEPEAQRLAWYGVHTLTASEILGTAALVLAIVGPRLVRMSFSGWFVRLVILCMATAGTQGRTTFVGLIVAVPVALWTRQQLHHATRAFSVVFYGALGVAVILLYQQQLFDLATRGEGTERLASFDGRLPLWQLALSQVDTLRETFLGSGLGSSGLQLVQEVSFAGHAHNVLIEGLLSAGVIGVVLLLVWLITVGNCLRGRHLPRPLPGGLHAAFAATLGLLVVLGIGSPELAGPSYSYNLTCFIVVFLLREPVTALWTRPSDVAVGIARGTVSDEDPAERVPALAMAGADGRTGGNRPTTTIPTMTPASTSPAAALGRASSDEDPEPRVVFVAGTLRSGSTVLGRLLGGVPGVATLGEALLTWRAFSVNAACSCGEPAGDCPYWSVVRTELLRLRTSQQLEQLAQGVEQQVRIRRLRYSDGRLGLPDQAVADLAEGLRELYLAAARVGRADVLVDTSKSPAALPVLLASGLRVDVLHLIRDPRAVAYSESRRKAERNEQTAHFRPPSRSALSSAANWVGMNALIEQMSRDPRVGSYAAVEYEDLARDPVGVGGRLVRELGLAVDLPLLQQDGRTFLRPSDTHELAGNPNRFDRGMVPVESDDEWQVALDSRTRQLVNLLTLPGRRRRYRRS